MQTMHRFPLVRPLVLVAALCAGCQPGGSSPARPTTETAETPSPATDAPTRPPGGRNERDAGVATSGARASGQTAAATAAPPLARPTDEQLARWRTVSAEPLQLLAIRERGTTGFVSFVSATNDGRHYLLAGTKLTLWSLGGEAPEHVFLEAMTTDDERLRSFAVSPVGEWCAVGNGAGLLRVFSLAERKETAATKTGAPAVAQIAIAPDGKEIATIPYDREITIWNAESLEKKTSFTVDARGVAHLRYLAPRVLLVAGETMSTWDTASGQRLQEYPSDRYQTAIGLSPDGKELLFGKNQMLQRRNLESSAASREYQGGFSNHEAIRFTSPGTQFATSNGSLVRIWDAASGQLLQAIDAGGNAISDVSWAPNSRLLIVASDTGRVRIWGTPEEGQAFGLRPVHQPVAWPDAAGSEPATVAQSLEVVDLRLLPKLPQSKPQSDSFYAVNYTAHVGKEEAKTFYRHILADRGWKETFDPTAADSLRFNKRGFLLALSFYENPERPAGASSAETYVNVNFLGNYDLRTTPKLDEYVTETVFASDNTVMYKARASLLQIETALLRTLHRAGWTSIARLNSSHNEEPNGRDMEFVRNGAVLRVFVQPDRDDPAQYVIQYGCMLTLHSLPVPPDAGLMEWDNTLETQMVANTSLSLGDAAAFYDREMVKQGWLPREAGRRVDDDICYLPFVWGQRDTTIGLERLADGMVRIRAGKYSDQSWQPASSSATTDPTSSAAAADEGDEGLEAADVPILHASGPATYDSATRQVTYELEEVSLVQLSQQFSQALEALGWTPKAFGEPSDRNLNLVFNKGSQTIDYHSSVDPRGRGNVLVRGDGLRWQKQTTIRELVSYEAWMRTNKFPATLKRIDEYQAEMEQLGRAQSTAR